MAEMQKQGRPTDAKPDEWDRDLHPQPMAGINHGLEGPQTEKNAPTAYELKELHNLLTDYTDDELKQIPVLPPGTRLQQGAKYIDLMDAERQEITAMGGMESGPENKYVPKTEVGYELWNRLRGVQNPDRTAEANES